MNKEVVACPVKNPCYESGTVVNVMITIKISSNLVLGKLIRTVFQLLVPHLVRTVNPVCFK